MPLHTRGERIFSWVNNIFLLMIASICLLPMIHVIALSLSDNVAVAGGYVKLLPVRFTMEPYKFVIMRYEFWRAFNTTILRVVLGVSLNLLLIILSSYPLSKPNNRFDFRTVYVWLILITMLFNGGLIPNYLLVTNLNLRNTIWALVLPGAVNAFNIILLINFFRQLPSELEDAALIDGAGHFRTLFRIYIPCSLPAIATITLFCVVGHWNSWFDGLIYMMRPEKYPLQTYLYTAIVKLNFANLSIEEIKRRAALSERSVRAAQIVVGVIPILMTYPFLQKYFVKGIVLGSVKG